MVQQAPAPSMMRALDLLKTMIAAKAVGTMSAIPQSLSDIAGSIRTIEDHDPTVAEAVVGIVKFMIEGNAFTDVSDVAGQIDMLGSTLMGSDGPAAAGTKKTSAPAAHAHKAEPAPAQKATSKQTVLPGMTAAAEKKAAAQAQKMEREAAAQAQEEADAAEADRAEQASQDKKAADAARASKAAKATSSTKSAKAAQDAEAEAEEHRKARIRAADAERKRIARKKASAVRLAAESKKAGTSESKVAAAAPEEEAASMETAQTVRPASETGQKPFCDPRKSVQKDFIVCLEDGREMKMLKRHLRSEYGLSPEEYRFKWGLPPNYPMVAPNYAEQKSRYAKSLGLGSKEMREEVNAKRQNADA